MLDRRVRWGFLTATLTISLAAAPPPASAQIDSCSDCHDTQLAEGAVHEIFGCADCHSDVVDFPHAEDLLLGDQICAQCHDAGEALDASVHAGIADCQSCHGAAHEILPVSAAASPVAQRQQMTTCGQCHEDELIQAFTGSVHGEALLKSGLALAPSCSGCHGAHDVLPAADPESRVSPLQVPDTCGDCHVYILDDWRELSAHGLAWQAGDEAAPVCNTCHRSHAVAEPGTAEARLGVPGICGECHGGRFESYRDGFHGQVSSLGFVSAANCADCHTPHQNLPAEDPRSSIHPDNLAETCGQCHDDVNAAFLSYDPHSDPTDPERNAAVYYIWLFMTSLLLGVFGFFGLHAVLWFQRSLVGWLRGELAAHASLTAPGPYVRRFRPLHRWVHVTIIVTFLTLAATGLPIKFHDTAWAQALASVPGGIVWARWVHRLAAILTFGYALVHLGYLVRQSFRDRGILFGWKSMVPRGKDFVDLWRNVKYFLYLGPQPRFDRYTYWEKFDYFAVFWGVPIIGLSGLMLWFPGVVTRFLPGWALNAAHVVHSDEALLATGFIFVFHFFHTHLRPESFPLDPVMFVGSMPLERFQQERPVEYERLVASGELDAYLVEAPSPERMRRVRIFGFLALGLGIVIAIAILWSLLAY